jgi:hypothetical protein
MGMTRSYDKFNMKVSVLAGAAADTNIAVTGIATDDVIISALVFATAAAITTLADLTSEVVVLTAGNIQFTDTSTANNAVVLIWMDVSL